MTRPLPAAPIRAASIPALAVPALVVLAAEPLYLLVDTAVVGHLDKVALGGLAVGGGLLAYVAALLDGAVTSVVVDHHASNPGFGALQLIDPAAPATVTLVADLLDDLGVALDQQLATCLYAGLAPDTGSFRFGSTRPRTHELAARLLATGIDHAAISRRLFDTAPFGLLGLLSVVTGRAVLEPEVGAGLVWTWSSTAEAAEHGLPGEQLEALVDVVRSAEEADVACVLKGQDDGTWSVSLRSRGGTDLARIAMELGGGGHTLAAGYTSTLDREGTIAALRDRLTSR